MHDLLKLAQFPLREAYATRELYVVKQQAPVKSLILFHAGTEASPKKSIPALKLPAPPLTEDPRYRALGIVMRKE